MHEPLLGRVLLQSQLGLQLGCCLCRVSWCSVRNSVLHRPHMRISSSSARLVLVLVLTEAGGDVMPLEATVLSGVAGLVTAGLLLAGMGIVYLRDVWIS